MGLSIPLKLAVTVARGNTLTWNFLLGKTQLKDIAAPY